MFHLTRSKIIAGAVVALLGAYSAVAAFAAPGVPIDDSPACADDSCTMVEEIPGGPSLNLPITAADGIAGAEANRPEDLTLGPDGQPLSPSEGRAVGQPDDRPVGSPDGQPLGPSLDPSDEPSHGQPDGRPVGQPDGRPVGPPDGEPFGPQGDGTDLDPEDVEDEGEGEEEDEEDED